jgi:hypothetical protein
VQRTIVRVDDFEAVGRADIRRRRANGLRSSQSFSLADNISCW